MKRHLKIVFILVLLFSFVTLVGCDKTTETGEEILTGQSDTDGLKLSDYSLPENFYMTLLLSDTSIFNKGDPWYFKTVKIGNDWQLIEYDRDLEDRSKQATHFFKYLSEDSYKHYAYNYTDEAWTEVGTVSFQEMVLTSANNFKFLYQKPTQPQIEIVETALKFDCDPTSIESLRDALLYEYSDGLDIEVFVDKAYPNMALSETDRDNSRICVSWRVYELEVSLDDWDSFYLEYRNVKAIPE